MAVQIRPGPFSPFGWYPRTVRRIAREIVGVCGLVVRIAGFHPAGPGSIPGSRIFGHFHQQFVLGSSWCKKISKKRSKADLNRHRWIQSPEC